MPIDAISGSLRDAVEQSLSSYLYDNATFLAERLYAHSSLPENLHLLATCLYRSGQQKRVIHLLRDAPRIESIRFLLGLCHYELGNLEAAESALVGDKRMGVVADVPNGAAGLHLLGQICRCALFCLVCLCYV